MLTHTLTTEVHVSAFHQPIVPIPLTPAHCVLQKLPGDDNSDDYFTEFQITTGENISPITTTTNRNSPFGMYVDRNDEWKVKLTNDRKLWDKFTIGGKKAYQ